MTGSRKNDNQKRADKAFGEIFSKLLTRWKEEEPGRGQKAFAEKYKEVCNETIGQGQVSKWCNGYSQPDQDQLNTICEIFGVKPSDFVPDSIKLYTYSESESDKYLCEQVSKLCEDYWISRDFLKALKQIPDYDDLFPLWTPLTINAELCKEPHLKPAPYLRCPVDVLAGIEKSERYDYLQVRASDGEYKPYSLPDIAFLCQLQYATFEFIKQRLADRAKELRKNAVTISDISIGGKAKYKKTDFKPVPIRTIQIIDGSESEGKFAVFPEGHFVPDDDYLSTQRGKPKAIRKTKSVIDAYKEHQQVRRFAATHGFIEAVYRQLDELDITKPVPEPIKWDIDFEIMDKREKEKLIQSTIDKLKALEKEGKSVRDWMLQGDQRGDDK